MNPIHVLSLFATLATPGLATAQLSFDVRDPAFHVVLPSVPAMPMEAHPLSKTSPHLRLMGSQGPFTVSVLTPTADTGMTPADCASSTVGALPRRPGVPSQDSIYKERLDGNTYLAIYITPLKGSVQMHAHVMSAAGGSHCVEVHASRVSTSKDDLEPWLKGFREARIEPQ